jgi:hypothetical protein
VWTVSSHSAVARGRIVVQQFSSLNASEITND